MSIYSKGIKRSRENKGISQQELGAMLGVSQQTVDLWERGVNLPDSRRLPFISDALGVTLDDLREKETA